MPPKQQQQPQNQPQQKPPPSGKCSGSKPPGGDGSGKPAGQMNYFAALAGIADADALKDEIAVEEEQRRAASSSNGAAAAANGRRSRNVDGEGGGMKQPLIWIDLEMTGLDVESDQILQIAVICTGRRRGWGKDGVAGRSWCGGCHTNGCLLCRPNSAGRVPQPAAATSFPGLLSFCLLQPRHSA